jgi:hypothetical protein
MMPFIITVAEIAVGVAAGLILFIIILAEFR